MYVLKIFLIINLSIVLASCSNSIIVKIDKDKRIITRELKNGEIKTINQNQLSKKHGYKPGIPLINSRIMNSKEEIRHEMVRPLPKSQGIGKRKQIPFTLPSMSQSIIEAT